MKIYGIFRTVIYWALTALVFVFLPMISEIGVLRYFIGGLMIFYGVEEIVYTVFKSGKHYSLPVLYWNAVEIVIGIVLIAFVKADETKTAYAIVCVSWAIWSILRETRELVEATQELKENRLILSKIVAVVNLLESLTVIALSLTMLIEPGEHHAKIHLYLLAIELFTKVLFPILNYLAALLDKKRKAKAADTVAAPAEPEAEAEEAAAEEAIACGEAEKDASDEVAATKETSEER